MFSSTVYPQLLHKVNVFSNALNTDSIAWMDQQFLYSLFVFKEEMEWRQWAYIALSLYSKRVYYCVLQSTPRFARPHWFYGNHPNFAHKLHYYDSSALCVYGGRRRCGRNRSNWNRAEDIYKQAVRSWIDLPTIWWTRTMVSVIISISLHISKLSMWTNGVNWAIMGPMERVITEPETDLPIVRGGEA